MDLPEHIWALIACVALTVIFGIVGELDYQDALYVESQRSDGTAPPPKVGAADSALHSN
jgi:hypothetical protein